jgi:hypothetical protein
MLLINKINIQYMTKSQDSHKMQKKLISKTVTISANNY